jgi:hypothetical protein
VIEDHGIRRRVLSRRVAHAAQNRGWAEVAMDWARIRPRRPLPV